MGEAHDRAARLIANKFGGDYDPTQSPDVTSKNRRIEVKTYASEVPIALDQLGSSPKKKRYVSLPANEHESARQKLEGSGVGIIDRQGNIRKRARRQ